MRAKIRLPPVPRPLRLSKIKTTVTSGPEAAGQLPGRTCSWKRLWAGHELGSAETQRVTGASGADFPCRRIGGFCYSVDSIKVFLYKSQVAAGPAAAGLGPQTPGSVQEKLNSGWGSRHPTESLSRRPRPLFAAAFMARGKHSGTACLGQEWPPAMGDLWAWWGGASGRPGVRRADLIRIAATADSVGSHKSHRPQ